MEKRIICLLRTVPAFHQAVYYQAVVVDLVGQEPVLILATRQDIDLIVVEDRLGRPVGANEPQPACLSGAAQGSEAVVVQPIPPVQPKTVC